MTPATAHEALLRAWWEAHPNQPMPEGQRQVAKYLGVIVEAAKAEAAAKALADAVERSHLRLVPVTEEDHGIHICEGCLHLAAAPASPGRDWQREHDTIHLNDDELFRDCPLCVAEVAAGKARWPAAAPASEPGA